jgi:hypothetical protein
MEGGAITALTEQPTCTSNSSIPSFNLFLLSLCCVDLNSSYGFRGRIRGGEDKEEAGRGLETHEEVVEEEEDRIQELCALPLRNGRDEDEERMG